MLPQQWSPSEPSEEQLLPPSPSLILQSHPPTPNPYPCHTNLDFYEIAPSVTTPSGYSRYPASPQDQAPVSPEYYHNPPPLTPEEAYSHGLSTHETVYRGYYIKTQEVAANTYYTEREVHDSDGFCSLTGNNATGVHPQYLNAVHDQGPVCPTTSPLENIVGTLSGAGIPPERARLRPRRDSVPTYILNELLQDYHQRRAQKMQSVFTPQNIQQDAYPIQEPAADPYYAQTQYPNNNLKRQREDSPYQCPPPKQCKYFHSMEGLHTDNCNYQYYDPLHQQTTESHYPGANQYHFQSAPQAGD
jgi:hypothetical protein